jgi:hypothetical protein
MVMWEECHHIYIRLGTPGARFDYLARQCLRDRVIKHAISIISLDVLINAAAGNQAKILVKAEGTSLIYPGKQ